MSEEKAQRPLSDVLISDDLQVLLDTAAEKVVQHGLGRKGLLCAGGERCAVGWCLTEVAAAVAVEWGLGTPSAVFPKVFPDVEIANGAGALGAFLSDVMAAHDNVRSVEQYLAGLRGVAEEYKLSTTRIDELEKERTRA